MIYLNHIIVKRGSMFWYETEKLIKKGQVLNIREEGKFLVTKTEKGSEVERPDEKSSYRGPTNVHVSRIK